MFRQICILVAADERFFILKHTNPRYADTAAEFYFHSTHSRQESYGTLYDDTMVCYFDLSNTG